MRHPSFHPTHTDTGATHPVQPPLQRTALLSAGVLLAALARPAPPAAATDQSAPVVASGVVDPSCPGTASARIRATRMDKPAGTQRLKIKGSVDLGAPIADGLDPVASGFALAIRSAGGSSLYQVTLPAGAYSRDTGEGWKPSTRGGSARWQSKTGISGVTRVKLVWDDASGQGSFDLSGKDLSLVVAPPDLPLGAEVWLDPEPLAGLCGLASDVAPGDVCAFNAPGSTLSCQIYGEQTPANPCVAPVVWLKTGPDPSCGGQNTHAWPVGMAASDCHGWRAVDNAGQQHDNSANDIRCNVDGSFSFVQFAGNLDCTGSGTLKDYLLNACEQDIPPTLYTVAFDLTCCSNPADPACSAEVPSVSVAGGSVFLNGAACVTD